MRHNLYPTLFQLQRINGSFEDEKVDLKKLVLKGHALYFAIKFSRTVLLHLLSIVHQSCQSMFQGRSTFWKAARLFPFKRSTLWGVR